MKDKLTPNRRKYTWEEGMDGASMFPKEAFPQLPKETTASEGSRSVVMGRSGKDDIPCLIVYEGWFEDVDVRAERQPEPRRRRCLLGIPPA